ncbi:MAG: LamG domain-containing protein, partial [Flavisolibacter sp.]
MKTTCLFFFLFLLGIIPKLSHSQVNLSRGLVAHYPFTGNVSDVSANANHGQTFNGVQLTTDRLGVPNSAYSFDGVNDFIKIPNSSSINASSAMSITLYFNPSQNTVQTLIGKISQSGGIGTQFQIAMGFPPFPGVLFGLNPPATGCNTQLSLNNSYVNTGASTPILNQWHCLVATFENGVQKIYLNGALIQIANTGFNILNICSNSDIQIGTWWSGDPQWYKGKIDDVRIYDRAINQHEVNALCVANTVTPGFTIPDTVCVGTPVNIQNTTTGATTNYWNFCVADMNVAPTGLNMGNVGSSFSSPVFMDYAFYNGNYYGFVVNHSPGGLVRLDFGNSLLNTPTRLNLGNFGGIIPTGPGAEGIQVVFNEGSWYAIIVGGYLPTGSTPRILKLEFGANLDNPTPIATNWGNIGNMNQPIDLHVFKEGNNWYGLTVNSENNSITRFNFTS